MFVFCLIQACWFLFTQGSLEIPFQKLVFSSNGSDLWRVLFKPASHLCYPLSRPHFWKLCSFIQKHSSLLFHNRKMILETFRDSAVGNQTFLWSHSFERWDLLWGDLCRRCHEGISPMCPDHISSLQNLSCSFEPFCMHFNHKCSRSSNQLPLKGRGHEGLSHFCLREH